MVVVVLRMHVGGQGAEGRRCKGEAHSTGGAAAGAAAAHAPRQVVLLEASAGAHCCAAKVGGQVVCIRGGCVGFGELDV